MFLRTPARTWLLPVLVAVLGSVGIAKDAEKQKPAPKPDYSAFKHKLPKDQQNLQILNRLTYGPRPQDLDEIKAMGAKKWVDLQLHPEKIAENPELARRLEPLETLRLSSDETARNYPNPQMVRAVAMGKQKLPDDPVARAAIERGLERFRAFRNSGNFSKSDHGNSKDGNSSKTDAEPSLDSFLDRDQVRALRAGNLEQRRAILAAIPEDQWDGLAIALPQGLRGQLLPAAAPVLRRKLMLMSAPQQLIASDLSEGKLYRAIYSNRQLEEQLTDFWYNHFNVFLDKGSDRFMVPSYEREAIRPNVLGNFRKLLEATATSPAMMFYLDNWESVAPDPKPARNGRPGRGLNENYARELMELQTLGVDGGYTQKDVTEVARCFTGWSIRAPREGGGFFFNPKVHDKGEKIVLGVKIPAGGGQQDGEKVLDILAKHPSTARFISRKLAQRFVADDPPPALIDRMAKRFQKTNGDVREVMKVMFTSNEFLSQGAFKSKMKSPLELVVSAVRASGADVDYAFPLANRIAQMGQPLYRKLEPTGYSNVGSEWMSTSGLLARMNFALALARNQVAGAAIDPAKWPVDSGDAARRLLLADAAPETLEAIRHSMQDSMKEPNSAQAPNSGQAPNSAKAANGERNSTGPSNSPAATAPVASTVPASVTGANSRSPTAKTEANRGGLIAGLVLGSPEFQKR